ncbi:MAG TPA: 1,4-dihydroxy-2-naphthoate octaprenyltransferase [Elusimicrobiales bacterium]|nr:1,4-dihydroxy-2-naphthoate octaprenyltransferase [Elusimicrobiales bacterium]
MSNIFLILRAYSWPASIVPVLIGSAVARRHGTFSWTYFWLTLLAALSVHSGANLANTYFDFRNGVDKRESADDRGLVDGLISPSMAMRLALSLFAVSAAIGLWLSVTRPLPELTAVGLAGFMLAWFYTAGLVRYKYRALGDLGIFLAFGPLIVSGTALIQAGRFLPEALTASLPAGLLIAAIVHANNMRDSGPDRDSGVRTLAGSLGPERARLYYLSLLFAPYPIAWACGNLPGALSALSLPAALKLASLAARNDHAALVRGTAGFVAVFGVLFSAGILLR